MGLSSCIEFLIRIIVEIKYQIIYYALGGTSQIDDFIYARSNKVELVKKIGEIAVVTGGSRGIGIHVVKMLLQCNMHVIIGCRNTKAGEDAVAGLRAAGIQSGTYECHALDTSSLASVRRFAEAISSSHPLIHVLINNAGIMFAPFSLTEDGFESHQAVNYIGHYLLTMLLLPLMDAAGRNGCKARIVNVTSCAYMAGKINYNDFNNTKNYIASAAYAQSKLAQLISTVHLSSLFLKKDVPINVYAVHPGVVNTELFNGTAIKTIFPWIPKYLFKSPEKGAAPVVYAAISPVIESRSGAYISNCRELKIKHPLVLDSSEGEKLHRFTDGLIEISKPIE